MLYHDLGSSKSNVVDYVEEESEVTDLIPSHMKRSFDEENIVFLSVFVVS